MNIPKRSSKLLLEVLTLAKNGYERDYQVTHKPQFANKARELSKLIRRIK